MQSAECRVQSDCTKSLLTLIGLQFFAEDLDDDFTDDFDDIPEYYGWDHAEEDEEVQSAENAEKDEEVQSAESGDQSEDDADDAGEADDADGEEVVTDDSVNDFEDVADEGEQSEDGAEESEDNAEAAGVPPRPTNDTDGADDAQAELISELQALGYVGDDLASLVQDMRRKREDAKAAEASVERRARNAESMGHISSARPQRSVALDGADGFSAKQVRNLQQSLGCSYEKARDLLAKQVRAIG